MAERTPTKGRATRDAILDEALHLSSELGLEGLTIGVLAARAGLSKSGLYAHFDSKESLQCAVLDAAAVRFIDVVIRPALRQPRGVPRIERLFELWVRWEDEELAGGCPIIAAATDFDDRPGLVRDKVAGYIDDMIGAIQRAAQIAVEEGHFRSDLDTKQYAYEMWGTLLAHQQYRRLLGRADALDRARRAVANLNDRSRPETR